MMWTALTSSLVGNLDQHQGLFDGAARGQGTAWTAALLLAFNAPSTVVLARPVFFAVCAAQEGQLMVGVGVGQSGALDVLDHLRGDPSGFFGTGHDHNWDCHRSYFDGAAGASSSPSFQCFFFAGGPAGSSPTAQCQSVERGWAETSQGNKQRRSAGEVYGRPKPSPLD